MSQRLGRVGEAVEDDPAAQGAAGDPDQRHLGDRSAHELVLQRLEHRSMVVGRQDRAGAGKLDDRAAVGGFENREVEYISWGAERDL